ncbi:hypothetical protein LSAT2_005634 [Lamellibrachia satsuma]|nr:hypothetical protein LSAT2_005634 [Lamellibrachia satsuma]
MTHIASIYARSSFVSHPEFGLRHVTTTQDSLVANVKTSSNQPCYTVADISFQVDISFEIAFPASPDI